MARKSAPMRKPPSRSAKSKAKPKQGGRDREAEYAHFLEAAREAEASTGPKDFEKALKPVTTKPSS
ncbi:MAG TPA: hypothetical protein VHW69_06280 [Rhizomicrobium sp.]|jgi:hypothetical protein|nr:hypothetical protein [Rhizomicrobium sp.]